MSLEEFMKLPYKKRHAVENRPMVKAEAGKWVHYTMNLPVKVMVVYEQWAMVRRSDVKGGSPWACSIKKITLTPKL